jgi:hypothetical protein
MNKKAKRKFIFADCPDTISGAFVIKKNWRE